MVGPRRLVLFVEGEGERAAVPILVGRLLHQMGAFPDIILDRNPFVVGNAADLTAHDGREWRRYLKAARRKKDLGGILLVQDGDLGRIRGEAFCAFRFAARLALWARDAGAGATFSLAVVYACQEYESWVLGCADRLAGLPLPDGRPGIRAGTAPPAGDLETAPRDAKGWLNRQMVEGYTPTRDQHLVTRLLVDHLDAVRAVGQRSFRRLESALADIVSAVRAGAHIATPTESAPP